jgi:hypothetical protein
MGVPAYLGARVVLCDPAQGGRDVRIEERLAGLARVAQQRMDGMPANPGHRVFECAQNVRDSSRVGMLVEEFEAATTDYGALVGQPPDEGLDLVRGKRLAPIDSPTSFRFAQPIAAQPSQASVA